MMRTIRSAAVLMAALTSCCTALAQAEFAFHDDEQVSDVTTLRFREVVLRDEPARPIQAADVFDKQTRFGLLPLSDDPSGGILLAWTPASQPPTLWIDTNGNGEVDSGERHEVTGERITVPVRADCGDGMGARERTLVLRRAPLGGWHYAVRGYRAGRLSIGAVEYAAVLIDGNANGRFDDPGEDGIWTDLDADRVFDAFSERFPLGRALTVGDVVYAVRADSGGAVVRAQPRSSDTGTLTMAFTPQGAKMHCVSASLVSDIGELQRIDAVNEPYELPVSDYRLCALQIELDTPDGGRWRYTFSGLRQYSIKIAKDQATRVALPGKLEFRLAVKRRPAASLLYDDVDVSPTLDSDLGIYLTYCAVGRANDRQFGTPKNATILVLSDTGDAIVDVRSGFA